MGQISPQEARLPEAFVTEFDYEEKPGMNVLIFDGPSAEWFDFIIRNRKGTFTHDYDIILGPVADDSVYDTLFLFERVTSPVKKQSVS